MLLNPKYSLFETYLRDVREAVRTLNLRREKPLALAACHAVPTMHHLREFIAAGGLMTYGSDILDVYRQVGV